MLIIADENIPLVQEAFREFGQVITYSGREITREKLKEAEVLLVRSITRVNQELLEGTRVRFVATATIGTDHIDIDYLKERGIGFASASGSNANSVAEYVMTALLCLAHRRKFQLTGKTLGVVGVGQVGSKVVRMAKRLGMTVLENDPPLARETGDKRFKNIDEVIKADIVTFHVPLYYEGQDATFHMVNEKLLSRFKAGAILVNTSRGAVAETKALSEAIRKKNLSAAVIDVWENEPEIDLNLLREVNIATPHIAGYSFDGKVNATAMIYEAAAKFFGLKPRWQKDKVMPYVSPAELKVDARGEDEEILYNTIRRIYDMERDNERLRQVLSRKEEDIGPYFDRLRQEYPIRREFFNTTLIIKAGRETLRDKFLALGFKVRAKQSH